METFTELKPFVNNPQFSHQRQHCLSKLDFNAIDEPILGLIRNLVRFDFCFTLQSCYGHFVYEKQNDRYNTLPLPTFPISGGIEYRIAYIALCLENNENGKAFLKNLSHLRSIDAHYIQFGSADWFWDKQVNSFVLQVEPERFRYKDKAIVDYKEALYLEKIRNQFFLKLNNILSSHYNL